MPPRLRHHLTWSTGLACALAAAATGRAETLREMTIDRFVDATSIESLADIIVTDTKVALWSGSATQKIDVLRESDLHRMPQARNLADLMRYTSGQFVNVLSRNDANWGSYAGLGAKYNSYLLDGLPIDSFVEGMSLDQAMIERVEVHKGPASVLYSNYLTMDFVGNESALAGTTNFILKGRVEESATHFLAGLGSWDTLLGRFHTEGRSGATSYYLGAGIEDADYAQYGAPGSWLQTISAPDYRKADVYGNLYQELGRSDHTIALFVQHTGHDGTHGRPNRDYAHRYDTLNLSYGNRLAENWHLQFKAGQRRSQRGFDNDAWPDDTAATRYETTRQRIRPMDLSISHRHGDDHLLTFGIDRQSVRYRTASRTPDLVERDDNDAGATSTGLFAQDKLSLGDWTLRAGLRRNRIEHDYGLLGGNVPSVRGASWEKTLWSAGFRYRASPAVAFYGNAGTSFMSPAAKQIGGTVPIPSASGELANPDLIPESGLASDLGIDWRLADNLNLGARVFLNRIDDAIVSSVVSAAPSQTRSENAGRAKARGIEADLRYTPDPDSTWFANATLTDTRVRHTGNADQDGTRIPFAPDAVVNLGVSAPLAARTRIAAYSQWVGRYYDSTSRTGRRAYGRHGILNMRFLHALRDDTELVLDLNNLTDSRHAMPFEFVDPGFNAFFGIRLTR